MAFAEEEVTAIGGFSALKDILCSWGYDQSTYEYDGRPKLWDGCKYVRLNFVDHETATKLFQDALQRFTLAWGSPTPDPPSCSPQRSPLAFFWMNSTFDGGYKPSELPGLIVWDFRLGRQKAIDTATRRLCERWKCSIQQLPLFCYPRLFVSSLNPGKTTVKVLAHYPSLAVAAMRGLDGQDSDISSVYACPICKKNSHTEWTCPAPKLRIRCDEPINITVKKQLYALISGSKNIDHGILHIWGGRAPHLSMQGRRFGYIAFSSPQQRDTALSLLTVGPSPRLVRGAIKVSQGLLDGECLTCGCSPSENRLWGTPMHDLRGRCPNIPTWSRNSSTVDLLTYTPPYPGSTSVGPRS